MYIDSNFKIKKTGEKMCCHGYVEEGDLDFMRFKSCLID